MDCRRRWQRPLALAAFAILVAALVHPVGAQTPTSGALSGEVPARGLALVVWDGGSVDALGAAAGAEGCALRSAWVVEDGAFLGHIASAPAGCEPPVPRGVPGRHAARGSRHPRLRHRLLRWCVDRLRPRH